MFGFFKPEISCSELLVSLFLMLIFQSILCAEFSNLSFCQLNGDAPKNPIKITGNGSRTAKDGEESHLILLILPVFFRNFPCVLDDDT